MSGKSAPIDLLVVGLGPAGSRAAEVAARAGLRVCALDRRRAPGLPVQCAEFVPAMLDQELAGQESITRQRIRAMAIFVESEPPDWQTDFPGRMIDRASFDAMLVHRAAKAGAECRFDRVLRTIGPDGAVALADGTVLRPRVIVGADGPRSAVGRAIGSVNRALVETRQVTVPLRKPHHATDIFLSADMPGGYGWLFPKGDTANLGVGVEPGARSRLKPLLDALHRRLVAEGRVGGAVSCRTGGAIAVGGPVTPHGRLGDAVVLLAGDAAGLSNPVTGAGIAAAAISGALAGEAAADWCAGNRTALDGYAGELDDLFGASLARARARREALLACHRAGEAPTAAQLRRGWIAYPDYWAA